MIQANSGAPTGGDKGRSSRPVGIVDIGSNSVRLVVYDGMHRTPLPLFNEKAICGLGVGLERSGRLNPEGVVLTFVAVARFVRLAVSMGVERLDIVATAATRDAEDGAAFVAELERRCGARVRVLSGSEEAELAALGVLCSIPDADGLVADLGGGSLELIVVSDGMFSEHATLPLGVLRLADAAGGNREAAAAVINRHLTGLDWMRQARGKALYAVGGSWRALARLCIEQMKYPLHVLDNFAISRADAENLVGIIAQQSRKSLEKVAGVSSRRIPNLPVAALLLQRLLDLAEPERLVFSIYGMREGLFFKTMPARLRRQDPLISACQHMARCAGRFPEHGEELMGWMSPLFPNETHLQRRLRRAACLLGDVFWNEHPDYRAEQAFLRVLRLPFMGLDHRERAGLALAVYHRYRGDFGSDMVLQARQLLDDERNRRATAVGLALRLGHTISGGAPDLLRRSTLAVDRTRLVLSLAANEPAFAPGVFDRRFEKLASALGLTPVIQRG
ncbi:MAG: Ppx/GppA family phosphatase [Alphaproteobacteria bacterium]